MLSLYDLFDSIISLRALCNLQTTSLHLPFVISPQFSFLFFQWWDDLFTTMKICVTLSFVRVLVKENILHDCNEFIIYRRYRSAQSRANYLFLYIFATQSLFSQHIFNVFVRNLIKALSLREAATVLIVDWKQLTTAPLQRLSGCISLPGTLTKVQEDGPLHVVKNPLTKSFRNGREIAPG